VVIGDAAMTGIAQPVLGTARPRPLSTFIRELDGPVSPDHIVYPVWYATNRKPKDPLYPVNSFTGHRDTDHRDAYVHYGVADVFVPKSHEIGSIGSSLWKRLFTGVDDRLKLIRTQGFAPAAFWDHMAAHLGTLKLTERDAVIFIHRFNVSFADALIRAAQLGADMSITGCMALCSWPSKGRKRWYTADEASIDASESKGAKTDPGCY
jgi:esterase/lipase superfamily enzyme